MTPDTLASLQTILQLGWPAIVTIACIVLWRQYTIVQNARIQDMKDVLLNRLNAIEVKVAGIEDELKIRRTTEALRPVPPQNTQTPN